MTEDNKPHAEEEYTLFETGEEPDFDREPIKSKNLIRLDRERIKRQKGESDKIGQGDWITILTFVIEGMPFPGIPIQHFKRRFKAVKTDSGVSLPVEVDDQDQVRIVSLEVVKNALGEWIASDAVRADCLYPSNLFGTTERVMAQAADTWLARTIPIPDPYNVRFRSEQGYCYRKLEFDPIPDPTGTMTPTFDEIFKRMKNAEAVAAWIGSLFSELADCQQYVWLYGDGMNGKSSIGKVLRKIFGQAFVSLAAPSGGNQRFFTHRLVGKRFGLFPDFDEPDFVTSGLFKQITGGDAVPCEIKGGKTYEAILNVKIMFLANERPDVSRSKADTRRAIYAELDPFAGEPIPTLDYDALLWNETPYFIGNCMALYESLCPNHESIPVSADALDIAIEHAEEEFQVVFDNHFEIDANSHVPASYIQAVIKQEGWGRYNSSKARRFIGFLKSKYGIESTVTRIQGKVARIYQGMGGKEGVWANGHIKTYD